MLSLTALTFTKFQPLLASHPFGDGRQSKGTRVTYNSKLCFPFPITFHCAALLCSLIAENIYIPLHIERKIALKNIKNIKWLITLISFAMIFCVSVQGTLCFISTGTDTITNTFTPFKADSNSLIISKAVEHPFGDNYKLPKNLSFDFEIELGSAYAGKTVTTSQGEKTADKNGNLALSINANSSLIIQNLKDGTKVNVTEKQNKNGFTVKNGETKQVVIEKNAASTVKFINTYSPKPVSPDVTVAGTKNLKGRDWKQDDSFKFILEYDGGNGVWQKLDTVTAQFSEKKNFNKFDMSKAVNSLEFKNIGTYSFRISEEKGENPDITYDQSIKSFRISVTDTDMDGKLEIGNIKAGENTKVEKNNISFAFDNEYSAPEDIAVDILVNKTVENKGTDKMSAKGFNFSLTLADGKEISLKTDKNGKALHTLIFTANDIGNTYTYELYEINDKKKYVTYSTESYLINITVSQDKTSGKLVADLAINGTPTDSIVTNFTNIYDYTPGKDPAPITLDITNNAFWLISMILSAAIVIFLLLRKRKPKA